MRDIHWLEQTSEQVPIHNDWLSSAERIRLSEMRIPKRNEEWRLGRWTAKRAASFCLGLSGNLDSLSTIEISPASTGAPEVSIEGHPANVSLSISHRSGSALCALALSRLALGCDLELIEEHSNGFIADYFTDKERAVIEASTPEERPSVITLLWSAKESALKAMQVGLRADTRSVSVALVRSSAPGSAGESASATLQEVGFSVSNPDRWQPLSVHFDVDRIFQGWWQRSNGFVRTIVTKSSIASLIRVGPIPASSARTAA